MKIETNNLWLGCFEIDDGSYSEALIIEANEYNEAVKKLNNYIIEELEYSGDRFTVTVTRFNDEYETRIFLK